METRIEIPPRQTVKQYIIGGRLRALPPIRTAAPHPVDVMFNPRDFLVCLLGSFGLSTECIATQTRLSPGQVLYRLKKGQVSRKDYRNGQSPMAKLVLKRTANSARPLLERQLQRLRLPRAVAA